MWDCNVYKWRRSKQMLSFIAQFSIFTRLHGVAVMQELTFRDSMVTLNQVVRTLSHWICGWARTIHWKCDARMQTWKIKSQPQPCENPCHPNVFEFSFLWMPGAQACFYSWPKINWISDWWLKEVWISAVFRIFWNYKNMNENNRITNLWISNSYI